MNMDVITQPLARQPKPFSLPNSQILIDSKCEDVQEKVYLNGVKSPVLKIDGSYIVLERPILRLYDGQWTAKYALETKNNGTIIYSQRFQVQITPFSNAMPKFKGHSRGQNLTTWEVHKQITDVYELPVIEDSNQFDQITISIDFNAETSEFLRNCNCFSIDQEQRLLRVTLPAGYQQRNDSLSITIDDGKDFNTYPIQLETKQWLIDQIIPIIEIYCSWALLIIAFLSAIAGLPTFTVWRGIFSLQIVSHIPLFSIDLPLNQLKFFVFLKRIVSFDLFQKNPLVGMGFTETKSLNQNFARLGYTSSNFFENLGALSLFTILLPMVLLFLKLCVSSTKFCKLACSTKVNKFFSWALIWNICAQFFLLSLIELLIATFIGLKLPTDLKGNANSHDKVAIVSAYLCLIELGLFMLYVFYYAGLKNADTIHATQQSNQNKEKDHEDYQSQSTDEEADPLRIYNKGKEGKGKHKAKGDDLDHKSLQRISKEGNRNQQERNQTKNATIWTRDGYTLLNGLREKSFLAGLFYFLFCLRRIFLVFVTLLGYGMGWLQMTIYLVQTVLWLTYLISHPFENLIDNFIEILNELFLLMIGVQIIFYLINSTMDYSTKIEFGIFSIIIVCLLILINLICWIYGICIRIHKYEVQRKAAQVADKEIELKDKHLSQQFNKFDKENQNSLEMSNAQLKNTIRGLLQQIDEETESGPTIRKTDSSRFNQPSDRPIPIPANQKMVKPTTKEKLTNIKSQVHELTAQSKNQSKQEVESNEASAAKITISSSVTVSAEHSSSVENVKTIKKKSCKHHLFHKENCEKCIIANQNYGLKAKKVKLDAREKKKQKIEAQKIRLLAMFPSSHSSQSKSPREGESIESEGVKIEIKDNNLEFENEFVFQNQPFKGQQDEARLGESLKFEKTITQQNLVQQLQKINDDLVESTNLDKSSNQLLNAQKKYADEFPKSNQPLHFDAWQVTKQNENYQMESEAFDYELLKQSENFGIKQYSEAVYRGELQNGKRFGLGIVQYRNGRVYEGQWDQDMRNGRGMERYSNGDRYEGLFVNGKPHGKGVYTWANGEVYDGEWINGLKEGQGIWRGIFGDQYIGEWRQSKATGYGVHQWKNGDKYEGEWLNSLKHGQGSDIFANGEIFTGTYFHGEPVLQEKYKQINGTVQICELQIDALQNEKAEPKGQKVQGKIEVSVESDEMIQDSVGFEIKWNIEYSNSESDVGIIKNTNSNSVQDLTKLCLEKVVKDEVINETQRNTPQRNDYELSDIVVKGEIIQETQRVTPQHNGCRVSQINLSELSIKSKELKGDQRHISIDSVTQNQQSQESKELKNKIGYNQNEAKNSIPSDYETVNAEMLKQGIEQESQRTLRVSYSCDAIDSRQSPNSFSHSEIEHKNNSGQVKAVDCQKKSEKHSPNSQQSAAMQDYKNQDLINTQAQLLNEIEPEIENQNFESQSQQQEDLTRNLDKLPQKQNLFATVMDKEPHHKAQMTIQEFRQIRSVTADKETGMSSAVRYDTKVDCAKNSSAKMSLKTGQSDKMNFKGYSNSNFSPHTAIPQVQSKVVDLIILSNSNRRMMLASIESAVVDIEILADQESSQKQNKDTIHNEHVESTVRLPFPAFGKIKAQSCSENRSEHIKSARTIPKPAFGLDSRQASLETLSKYIRSVAEFPLPTFGFQILSDSHEIQCEVIKTTATIPRPIFGIVTVQANLTTSYTCSPTKLRISENSMAKLSQIEEKASISQGGKKTAVSTTINSQMPRLRRESGDFVNSMVILEQSINKKKGKTRPISAYPQRHAKSLNPNQKILASETILNDESDYGDECVLIFSPNRKQKTQGKSSKRRYVRQKRDRTIPKSTVNPFEEPILKSTGWTNYQIDLASNNTKAREFLRTLNQTGQLESLIPSSAYTSQKNNIKQTRDNYVRSAALQKNRKKKIQQVLKDNQEKLKMSVTMPKSKSQWRVAPMSLNDSNESTEF